MTRVIMNARPGEVVDHITHAPVVEKFIDNRKINLRLCTFAENLCNSRPPQVSSTSNYKGVYWNKGKKKWHAQISIKNRNKHIGYFQNELAAAKAYDGAARVQYGEFACTNESLNLTVKEGV